MPHAIFVGACIFFSQAKAACWEEAAAMYGHDPYLLKAIAWKESKGHVQAVGSLLKDGNRALGLMQINTIHLPNLRKKGIYREDLFDPCTSQKVGAWVLADCLSKFGEIWRAVGCYYGGPASKAYTAMRLYAQDVRKYYEGYKRKANLPIQYQPMLANQGTTNQSVPVENNNSGNEPAFEARAEKPKSIKIISFFE
ncbi:lytic transglycosylase domain-containing protein (plasmid) [Acinetobacter indicus]|nr:lytic transglycosylase domain-containing protein [Acinetobacter indicus]UNW11171.1 lytic transglycosylase domain-containing protein [Acinetobacter indicus]